MSLRLVNGSFRVAGSALEGDRLRFAPEDPAALRGLGLPVRLGPRGTVVLRLQGVDTLEGHYLPPGARTAWRQAGDLVTATGASVLATLGFRRAEQDGSGLVTASVPELAVGYVLAGSVDRHGRLVGFAFPGRHRGRARDLAATTLDVRGLRDSLNWVLLRQGLAFPAFYSLLRPDLRAELAAAAEHARSRDRGVWPRDLTHRGVRTADHALLRSGTVMHPKLFRRLADYLELDAVPGQQPDAVSLAGFVDYLRARGDEVLTLPEGRRTGLDTVMEVRRNVLRVTVPVERLLFRER